MQGRGCRQCPSRLCCVVQAQAQARRLSCLFECVDIPLEQGLTDQGLGLGGLGAGRLGRPTREWVEIHHREGSITGQF